ncbi:MAG: response regulator transcription factor [Anaeromyxobacter sp.]|nr:response regulator transcription factor [Anaeromyxobacter sp.]MBL0274751.1 response regulator transcription factor [Anaeromyxobacter sp.]
MVHVVDDDGAIRDALAWLLGTRGLASRTWASAEAFLAGHDPAAPGCLVLDIRMEGMSGIELFDALRAVGSTLPVIFLTGHGDVPLAVAALKKGAFDFVEKPSNDNQLVDLVIEALRRDLAGRSEKAAEAGIAARLESLTSREREVMAEVLAGLPNKAIADSLGLAVRTVEVHRARLFEKMGVRSAVELSRVLSQVGR